MKNLENDRNKQKLEIRESQSRALIVLIGKENIYIFKKETRTKQARRQKKKKERKEGY